MRKQQVCHSHVILYPQGYKILLPKNQKSLPAKTQKMKI